ncbi:hypothetical protein D3C79_879640 [compost metagenome]
MLQAGISQQLWIDRARLDHVLNKCKRVLHSWIIQSINDFSILLINIAWHRYAECAEDWSEGIQLASCQPIRILLAVAIGVVCCEGFGRCSKLLYCRRYRELQFIQPILPYPVGVVRNLRGFGDAK